MELGVYVGEYIYSVTVKMDLLCIPTALFVIQSNAIYGKNLIVCTYMNVLQ